MASRIEKNRRAVDSRPFIRRWFSPAVRGLELTTRSVIGRHASGAVIDVGCGAMPYRDDLEAVASSYASLDIEPRADGLDFQCSVTDMAPVPDATYDTALCAEVLEHVAEPGLAVDELARILDRGGRLIVTVPFLARLHEEPHDYQRFTEHGLRRLLTERGFDVERIDRTGSVASFLGHQVSTATVGATFHIPVIGRLIWAINAAFVVAPSRAVDRLLGPLGRRLPLGYVAVAVKR